MTKLDQNLVFCSKYNKTKNVYNFSSEHLGWDDSLDSKRS